MGVKPARASAKTWRAVAAGTTIGALETDLRTVTPPDLFRLDVPGWFGGY